MCGENGWALRLSLPELWLTRAWPLRAPFPHLYKGTTVMFLSEGVVRVQWSPVDKELGPGLGFLKAFAWYLSAVIVIMTMKLKG